jgi:tripartite-type tricarboxylate transporter receptor subunit TctC
MYFQGLLHITHRGYDVKKTRVLFAAVLCFCSPVVGISTIEAAAYPERGIEVVIPFGVGGGSDTE